MEINSQQLFNKSSRDLQEAPISIKTGLVDLQTSQSSSSNFGYLLTPVSETSSSSRKRKGNPQRSLSKQDLSPGIVFKLELDQIYPNKVESVKYVNYTRMEHLEYREKYKRVGKIVKISKRQTLGLDAAASLGDSPGRKKRVRNLAIGTVSVPLGSKRRKPKQVLPASPPEESDIINIAGEDDLVFE